MQLSEIASEQPVTAAPSESVDKVFKLMVEHEIRHLPIVDGDKVVGIVSDRDLLIIVSWIAAWNSFANQSTRVGEKRVSELMSSPVSVLAQDSSVEQAARLMLQGRFGAVPLEEEGKLVGIVTETDIMRRYLNDTGTSESGAWRDLKVADHMSRAVVTGKPTDLVMPTYTLMQQKMVRHVPIVEGGKLVGLVSDRDLRRMHGKEIAVSLASGELEPENAYRFTLADCLSHRLETIDRLATLAHAASRMVHCKIGALPVIEQEKLLGIITETDLLKVFVAHCGS